jgi:hypothetical protein
MSLDGWSAGATRYCTHGSPEPACGGGPLIAACLPADYRYCAHGVQLWGDHCAYCRGVTRRQRNPDTWQPPRRRSGPDHLTAESPGWTIRTPGYSPSIPGGSAV